MIESQYHIPDILPPRIDFVFKRLFGDERNKDILSAFLKAVLELPHEEFNNIRFLNTELKKEYIEDKYGILDVRMTTTTGTQIDIEIQLHNKRNMIARSLYYWSKLYSEQVKEGQDYSVLCKTIAINILDFNLFDADRYHSIYLLHEKETKALLTDLIQIDFLELPKVRGLAMDNNDAKLEWMQFLASEKEEVFSMLADKNKDILKAYNVLQSLSSDPETREMYRLREKAIRDYNASIQFAQDKGMEIGIEKGKIDTIKKFIAIDIPVDQIAKATGLTIDEINEIKKELDKD